MAANFEKHERIGDTRFWRIMRWVVWGGAVGLLLLPLMAMQFTEEVNWTAGDFVVMGVMLGVVGLTFETAVRIARSHAYMVAAGIAVAAGFLMTWANLAVGIVGDENNPVNLIFFAIVAIAMIGAAWARLEPLRMARAMQITALAQVLAAVVILAAGLGQVFVFTGVLAAMWLVSAQLFQRAAGQSRNAPV